MEETDAKEFLKSPAFIILIITVCGVAFFLGLRNMRDSMKAKQPNEKGWTEEDRRIEVAKCLKDMKEKATAEPALAQLYCECSFRNIANNMSKEVYLHLSEKSIEEQKKVLMKWIEPCLNDYRKQSKFTAVQSINFENDTLIVK